MEILKVEHLCKRYGKGETLVKALDDASNAASSYSWSGVGARLAFYGKIVVVDSDTFKKMQA